jgi:hypothetical protein
MLPIRFGRHDAHARPDRGFARRVKVLLDTPHRRCDKCARPALRVFLWRSMGSLLRQPLARCDRHYPRWFRP